MDGEGHIYATLVVLSMIHGRLESNANFGIRKIRDALYGDGCKQIYDLLSGTRQNITLSEIRKAVLQDIYSAVLVGIITKILKSKKEMESFTYKYKGEKHTVNIPSAESLKSIKESLLSTISEDQSSLSCLIDETCGISNNWISRESDINDAFYKSEFAIFKTLARDCLSGEADGDSDSDTDNFPDTDEQYGSLPPFDVSTDLQKLLGVFPRIDKQSKSILSDTLDRYLKISKLKRKYYLLGCFLERKSVEEDHIPNYILSENEIKSYSNRINSAECNRQTEIALRYSEHQLNKDFGSNIPYLLLGAIGPDFFWTTADQHHIFPKGHNKSTSLRIRDQLHATLIRARKYANKRKIRETYYCLGVFLHFALDAMIVSSGYKKSLIYGKRSGFGEIRKSLQRAFGERLDDYISNTLHKNCDKTLFNVIKKRYQNGFFSTPQSLENNFPSHFKNGGRITNLVDKLAESFGCVTISNKSQNITELITYNNKSVTDSSIERVDANDPVCNAINCMSAILTIVLSEIPKMSGRTPENVSSFAEIFVSRTDHQSTVDYFKNLANSNDYSYAYILYRTAYYLYFDEYHNKKITRKERASILETIIDITDTIVHNGDRYAPGLLLAANIFVDLYSNDSFIKTLEKYGFNMHKFSPATKDNILEILEKCSHTECKDAMLVLCRFSVHPKYAKHIGFKNVIRFKTKLPDCFKRVKKEYEEGRITRATYSRCSLGLGIFYDLMGNTPAALERFKDLAENFPDLNSSVYPFYWLGKHEEDQIKVIYNPFNKSIKQENERHQRQAVEYYQHVKPIDSDKKLFIDKSLFGPSQLEHAKTYVSKHLS